MIPLVTTNIPLALVLGIIASMCFAGGATLQHLGVERNFAAADADDRKMTFGRLLQLLRTPLWLLGTVLLGLGAALHVTALGFGPLTVIQPIGILAVPASILLANRIYKTHTSRATWVYVALTIAGITAFTVISALTAVKHEHEPAVPTVLIFMGIVWAFALVFAGIGAKGPRWSKNLAWAWAGAFLYGLGSGFIKLLTVAFRKGDFGIIFWLSLVGLLLAYAIGGWMIQQAYASGPAEIVVGVMTTVDPVVAVLFGLIVLAEGRNITALHALGMVVTALLAALGVFLLSRYHPDAIRHREQAAGAGATEAKALIEEDHA